MLLTEYGGETSGMSFNEGEGDELQMGAMGEGDVVPPAGGVRIFPPGPVAHTKPGEPLYAQVNREKKKNRQYEGGGGEGGAAGTPQYEGEHWQYDERRPAADSRPPAGGDSWV